MKSCISKKEPFTFIWEARNADGLIRDVRFTSLDTPNTLLEFWPFNEGTGNTATSVEGTVLNLANTSWVRISKDDNDNDNKHDN